MANVYRVTVGGYIRFAPTVPQAERARKNLANELAMPKTSGTVEPCCLPIVVRDLIPFINDLLGEVEDSFLDYTPPEN